MYDDDDDDDVVVVVLKRRGERGDEIRSFFCLYHVNGSSL